MTERSIKMLKTALEMEEKGKKFYDSAITTCGNKLGCDIFKMLSNDELVHVDRINAIYKGLSAGKGWDKSWESFGDGGSDLGRVFRDLAKKYGTDIKAGTSDIKALEIGIDFENKSVVFYEESLSHATDPIERQFIEKMIIEEKSHHKVLSDMKFYLEDPSGYFAETERHGLDGM